MRSWDQSETRKRSSGSNHVQETALQKRGAISCNAPVLYQVLNKQVQVPVHKAQVQVQVPVRMVQVPVQVPVYKALTTSTSTNGPGTSTSTSI